MDPHWNAESEGSIGRPGEPFGVWHGHRLASWPRRVAAGVVDWLLLGGVPWAVFADKGLATTYVVIAILFVNSGYMAARTGQSLGKRLTGITMAWTKEMPDGSAELCFVPYAVALLRVPLHMLDCMLIWTGWFAPIFSRGRGTYADIITRTVNYADPRLPPLREVRGGRVEWPGENPR